MYKHVLFSNFMSVHFSAVLDFEMSGLTGKSRRTLARVTLDTINTCGTVLTCVRFAIVYVNLTSFSFKTRYTQTPTNINNYY